jgi:hypothetical protein
MLENGKNSLVAAVDKVRHEFSVVMLASLKSRFEPYISSTILRWKKRIQAQLHDQAMK